MQRSRKSAENRSRLRYDAVYHILILYYVMKSPEVSIRNKAIVIGALGYLILPLDLIPDFIPALGITDDITAIHEAFRAVKDSITPEMENQARRKCKQWFD